MLIQLEVVHPPLYNIHAKHFKMSGGMIFVYIFWIESIDEQSLSRTFSGVTVSFSRRH